MWRLVLVSALLCAGQVLSAQQADADEAVLRLLQNYDPEDVSNDEVERLAAYLSSPLPVNLVSLSTLRSSGLMSGYQAASLYDYRLRHGDVLTVAELAAVDGFGPDAAFLLAPFISLSSRNLPGAPGDSTLSVSSDAVVRTALKTVSGDSPPHTDWTYGIKARISVGKVFSASLAATRPLSSSSPFPDRYSSYIMWSPKRKPIRMILGDFNVRFGQGLALWNGMALSGMSSMTSFVRSPTGISPSWSFTGSSAYTGLAADVAIGRFSLTFVSALPSVKDSDKFRITPSLMPAANVSWNGRYGHWGLTHYMVFSGSSSSFPERIADMKTSFDLSMCIRGLDLAAESAYDWVNSTVAFLSSARLPLTEDFKLAASLRIYPSAYNPAESGASSSGTSASNEYAFSVLGQLHAGNFVQMNGYSGFGSSVRKHMMTCSLDAAYFPVPKGNSARSIQINAKLNYELMVSAKFRLKIRVSERFRSWGRKSRTDVRTDFSWMNDIMTVNMRLNALCSVKTGLLGYLEGIRSGKVLALSLRQGIFMIDEWEDRIYVYERDAPGSFNVPAMYGRGVWTSMSLSWKFSRWGRFYLRSSMTSFPFMDKENKKPGKAELKFQFQVSF